MGFACLTIPGFGGVLDTPNREATNAIACYSWPIPQFVSVKELRSLFCVQRSQRIRWLNTGRDKIFKIVVDSNEITF